jgi:hypothetical protein
LLNDQDGYDMHDDATNDDLIMLKMIVFHGNRSNGVKGRGAGLEGRVGITTAIQQRE